MKITIDVPEKDIKFLIWSLKAIEFLRVNNAEGWEFEEFDRWEPVPTNANDDSDIFDRAGHAAQVLCDVLEQVGETAFSGSTE